VQPVHTWSLLDRDVVAAFVDEPLSAFRKRLGGNRAKGLLPKAAIRVIQLPNLG